MKGPGEGEGAREENTSIPLSPTSVQNAGIQHREGERRKKEGRKRKRAAEPLRALAALAEDQGPVPSMNITTTSEPSVLGALMPSAWTGLWMLVLDVTSQKHTYI